MPKKDVKLSQNVNSNGKRKKKKNKRPISKFMTIFMIISLALLIFQIVKLNLLPAKLIVLVSLVMIILCLIILLILHFKAKKFLPRILAGFIALCMCMGLAYGNYFIFKTDNTFDVVIILLILHFKAKKFLPRILAGFIALCMCMGLAYGNYFIFKTDNTFDVVTSLADSKATMTSIVVLKSSSIKKEKDLKGKTIGTILDMDKVATKRMLKDLDSDNIKYKTKDYDALLDMMAALYDNKIDAICLNEKYRDILHEADGYFNFQTDSRVVHQNVHYTKVEKNDNPSDPVNDISKDAFTVLVSGNDSYGTLQDSNTRSDANLLLTVNPKTGTILMTSIPRDYYVELVCPEDDPELACGETALAFARERHAYLDGDNQRVRNQQKVFKAIFKRIISPKMITNYGKFMDAIAVAFDTNLSGDEISKFVKYELDNMPNWKIESYAIVAEPDYQFCYQSQSYASVVAQNDVMNEIAIKYELDNMPNWKIESYAIVAEPDYQFCYQSQSYASVVAQNDVMNEIARKKIQAVLKGKSSTIVKDPSGYSQTASEDNAVGNTEELQNMGILNPSGNDSSEYEEDNDYGYDYNQGYDDTEYYNPDDQYYQEDTYEESDYQ